MKEEIKKEYEKLQDRKENLEIEVEAQTETYKEAEMAARTVYSEHHLNFPLWIVLENEQQTNKVLGEKKKLKLADPALDRESLSRIVSGVKKNLFKSFKPQILSILQCISIDPDLAEFITKSSEQLKEQAIRAKKLTRETLLYAHPDKHSNRLDRSDCQTLRNYCEEILEIHSNMHFTPLHYQINEIQIRKLEVLKSRIHKILGRNGIDDFTDVSDRTIEDKVEHIKVEIHAYEAIIEEIDSKIFCLLNNERLNMFRAHLSLTDEEKQDLNKQITMKIAALRAKQDQLKAELESLFEVGSAA